MSVEQSVSLISDGWGGLVPKREIFRQDISAVRQITVVVTKWKIQINHLSFPPLLPLTSLPFLFSPSLVSFF